jgi:hypothetical protein
VLASDFFVVVTATLRAIYVFVVLEVGTRRILHWNVTEHPTAEWTAQQFRMIVPGDHAHRFVIHDRDTIYSEGVDRTLEAMGLAVHRRDIDGDTDSGTTGHAQEVRRQSEARSCVCRVRHDPIAALRNAGMDDDMIVEVLHEDGFDQSDLNDASLKPGGRAAVRMAMRRGCTIACLCSGCCLTPWG